MKKLIVIAACFLIISSASGQDIIERISVSICNCIDTIENMDSLQLKLDRCVPESIGIFFDSDAEYELDYITEEDTIKNTIDRVMENITFYCPKIKEFILADKEARYYKMSDSDAANELYTAGNKAFESKDYKTAKKKFTKAIKADPNWVLPYDDLGLAYRQTGDYRKAVRYYSKSLEIYPEGAFAIQNQAVAFTYLNDYERALENYDMLIYLYPKNPEGYFGKGKAYFLIEDYENALDYIFYCHKIYASQGSEYAKDTENLVSLIYNKMKEQNKLDIFNKKAAEHGITFNQN